MNIAEEFESSVGVAHAIQKGVKELKRKDALPVPVPCVIDII